MKEFTKTVAYIDIFIYCIDLFFVSRSVRTLFPSDFSEKKAETNSIKGQK